MFLGYDISFTHYAAESARNRSFHLNRKDSLQNMPGRLWTGNPLFAIQNHMDGSKEATYHVNLIYLLDRVFVRDSMNPLHRDQERFISRYLNQGGVVTNKLNTGDTNPYVSMDDVLKQLDSFLGSYGLE